MKIVFWISTIVLIIANYFLLMGFVNVFFKNYNGGPSSSSGNIVYQLIAGLILLIAGLTFYFTGKTKIATLIVAVPPALVILYLLFMVFLPGMSGK